MQHLYFVALIIVVKVACGQQSIEEVPKLTYTNPLSGIVPKDSPDPGAIYSDGKYYAATTSGDAENSFPIHASDDLVTWTNPGHIFPKGRRPTWAVKDFWAPEIHRLGSDYFVAYFAARDHTGMLCVGAAYSKAVLGPYTDIGHPLVRNATVGNIDPTFYRDNVTGIPYLIWKEDGNGRVPPEKYTPIWLQRLSSNGLSLVGDKKDILQNDPNSWEGPLVEAPWVIKNNGYFYLFYSANGYASNKYAIGVARSTSLTGPYEKNPANPIVHSDASWSGPGHCSVLSVENKEKDYFFLYHSWIGEHIGDGYPRVLLMDNIRWANGWPSITNSSPSSGPQPVPANP